MNHDAFMHVLFCFPVSTSPMILPFILKMPHTHRWASVITHVPCGGSSTYPAGRVLISASLQGIDGPGGILGSAGPLSIWTSCDIPLRGEMDFDIDDIASMEERNIFRPVIEHEMGHVLGIGWEPPIHKRAMSIDCLAQFVGKFGIAAMR